MPEVFNSMAPPQQIRAVLDVFERFDLKAFDFLQALLLTNIFEDHPVTESFVAQATLCLDAFRSSPLTAAITSKWVFQVAQAGYVSQVQLLTKKESGFHFYTKKITEEPLGEYSIDNVSKKMIKLAPDLWNLLAGTLSADPNSNHRHVKQTDLKNAQVLRAGTGAVDSDIKMRDVTVNSDATCNATSHLVVNCR
jgi:hypothetical protein